MGGWGRGSPTEGVGGNLVAVCINLFMADGLGTKWDSNIKKSYLSQLLEKLIKMF